MNGFFKKIYVQVGTNYLQYFIANGKLVVTKMYLDLGERVKVHDIFNLGISENLELQHLKVKFFSQKEIINLIDQCVHSNIKYRFKSV